MWRKTSQEFGDSNCEANTYDNLYTHNSTEGRLNQLFQRKPNVLHKAFEKEKAATNSLSEMFSHDAALPLFSPALKIAR